MNLAKFLEPAMIKRVAWIIIGIGGVLMLRAVWIGLHLKEAPQTHSTMMQWLAAGIGAYMIGRFILIRLRWVEKKRRKEA
ncbi:MAG: hypothetical protein RL318_2487 [Fibrobacterota bacterium]|jgi:hypothetical protein